MHQVHIRDSTVSRRIPRDTNSCNLLLDPKERRENVKNQIREWGIHALIRFVYKFFEVNLLPYTFLRVSTGCLNIRLFLKDKKDKCAIK